MSNTERMKHLTEMPAHIIFVILFIMPLNGFFIGLGVAKESAGWFVLGLLLIAVQIPFAVKVALKSTGRNTL